MGIAASNRGDGVIRRHLLCEQRDPLFALMDDLNVLPKYEDAGTPFTPVTLECGYNVWWVLGPTGAAGYGYWYPSLREAVRRWRIVLTGYNADTGAWSAIPGSLFSRTPREDAADAAAD